MGTATKTKKILPNEVDRFTAKVPGTNIWMTRFATGGGYFSPDAGMTPQDLLSLEKSSEKRIEINRIYREWCDGRVSCSDEVCIPGQKFVPKKAPEISAPSGP